MRPDICTKLLKTRKFDVAGKRNILPREIKRRVRERKKSLYVLSETEMWGNVGINYFVKWNNFAE